MNSDALRSIESFIAAVATERQPLVATLRSLILRTLPAATERVYPGWRAIGYRHPVQGYFCGIFPFETKVMLVFEWGVLLADPDRLLVGVGRQTRAIGFGPGKRVPVKAIQSLLRSAVALPPARAAKLDLLRGRAERLD